MTKGCKLRRWGRRCAQPICQHGPHPGTRCEDCSCPKYVATELPRKLRFGVCVWCFNSEETGFIIIRKNSANIQLRFHNPCYRAWRENTAEGKRYISLKRQGKEASLPSYKLRTRPKEEDLKIHWSWFGNTLSEGGLTPKLQENTRKVLLPSKRM
jgi:hypothetical protein